jgi:hypothetical protein
MINLADPHWRSSGDQLPKHALGVRVNEVSWDTFPWDSDDPDPISNFQVARHHSIVSFQSPADAQTK